MADMEDKVPGTEEVEGAPEAEAEAEELEEEEEEESAEEADPE